jgi:hypothetical protein
MGRILIGGKRHYGCVNTDLLQSGKKTTKSPRAPRKRQEGNHEDTKARRREEDGEH